MVAVKEKSIYKRYSQHFSPFLGCGQEKVGMNMTESGTASSSIITCYVVSYPYHDSR
jgi:hypothetical protein